MTLEIKVPELPESVADATVLAWHKQVGEPVNTGELLVELETDKVVLEVPAPAAGVLASQDAAVGDQVKAEALLGTLKLQPQGASARSEVTTQSSVSHLQQTQSTDSKSTPAEQDSAVASPSVRRLLREHNLQLDEIKGSGKHGQVLKADVMAYLEERDKPAESARKAEPATAAVPRVELPAASGARIEQRVPMTRLRARIAERLLEATQNTAMLTTFNEVNMQALMDLRQQYRDLFEKTHNTRLGFMSLFVKAATVALQRFPEVNASIDGNDIVYHGYCDIGIAVASERGLVVPMLRNTERMSMAQVEAAIIDYAAKAKAGKLSIEDLQGGTFTITNGGVFGSLLSTPILNPPQSAILGMHAIQKRAVVENDEIVIRPMMYVALSYDHRLIDGRGAVSFLKTIKELIEDPARILLEI